MLQDASYDLLYDRVPEGQHETVVIITNNLDTQTYIRITLRIYKYDVHIVLYDVYYINS